MQPYMLIPGSSGGLSNTPPGIDMMFISVKVKCQWDIHFLRHLLCSLSLPVTDTVCECLTQ